MFKMCMPQLHYSLLCDYNSHSTSSTLKLPLVKGQSGLQLALYFLLAIWTSGAREGWSDCHPTSGSTYNTWGCKWEHLCWNQV